MIGQDTSAPQEPKRPGFPFKFRRKADSTANRDQATPSAPALPVLKGTQVDSLPPRAQQADEADIKQGSAVEGVTRLGQETMSTLALQNASSSSNTGESDRVSFSLENGLVVNFDARTLSNDPTTPAPTRFTPATHDGAASARDINPHIGGCIVTGGPDKLVKVWNVHESPNGDKRDVTMRETWAW